MVFAGILASFFFFVSDGDDMRMVSFFRPLSQFLPRAFVAEKEIIFSWTLEFVIEETVNKFDVRVLRRFSGKIFPSSSSYLFDLQTSLSPVGR